MGIRRSDAASKYPGSFALSTPSTAWPWSHDFDHPHGSLPAPSPLLNFNPSWMARKHYACQLCYNSDHSTFECPLPGIKIGGVPLVSNSSRTLVSNKKPAERLVVLDRSLLPDKTYTSHFAPLADPPSVPSPAPAP